MLMGNSMYPRFVNGKEGLEVFNGMSDIECQAYPYSNNVKVWVGAYLGVYKYVDDDVNPTIIDKVKMVHLEVRRTGPLGLLVSMVTGAVTEVTCVPKQLTYHDLAVRFPQRTYFEKTVQEYSEEDYSMGLSACIVSMQKTRNDLAIPSHQYIELWGNVRNRFTDAGAFDRDVCRLKKEVRL